MCHATPMSLTMISLSLAFLSILYAPLQSTAANWHPSEGRCICWPPKGWGMKPCFWGYQKKVVSTTHNLLLLVEEFSKKQLRLVVYPRLFTRFYTSQVVKDFFNQRYRRFQRLRRVVRKFQLLGIMLYMLVSTDQKWYLQYWRFQLLKGMLRK